MSGVEALQDDPGLLARIAALQLVPANLHYLDARTRLTAFAARSESGTDVAACVDGFQSLVGTVTLVSVGDLGGSVGWAPQRRRTGPPLPGRDHQPLRVAVVSVPAE